MFSEQRYLEAIAVLTYIYDTNPTSRNNMTSSHTKYWSISQLTLPTPLGLQNTRGATEYELATLYTSRSDHFSTVFALLLDQLINVYLAY